MNKTFSFIACVSNRRMMEECRWYINRLYVPPGWKLEVTEITDAKSMCEGYNRAAGLSVGEAPKTEDVPVRIYLHQDVYILNRWFLHHLLALFERHPETGMIGMCGTPKLDTAGIMWSGSFIGNYYMPTEEPYVEEECTGPVEIRPVQTIDGFLMATRADIPWREDLFDAFDFYDVSQSLEFAKYGWQVAVPEQQTPWCVHGAGKSLSMYRYNRYRKIFLAHYTF